MKTTPQQLEQILIDIKRFTFVELEYSTEVKVKKRGNTKFIDYPVIKHTLANVGFNGSYQNSVNNRLDKKDIDPTFIAEPLPWGKWKVYPKIIEHNENIYVRFYVHKNSHFKNIYSYNGKIVEGDDLEELSRFLPESFGSSRQYTAGLDWDEQAIPLTIQITNINSITLDKIKYEL